LRGPATGYSAVYLVELTLLFVTLIAIGPLVGRGQVTEPHNPPQLNTFAGSAT
jgi:BCD family chlorophyll transporter-like MFS transporter